MNIFETRQRAQELLSDAIKIWRQSPQNEALEGMENDAVMNLLMTALAFQMNDADNEIERLKEEVVSEYMRMLTPYEMGHAVPASAVVEVSLNRNIPEWDVDTGSIFKMSGTQYEFMPILHTRVIGGYVKSVTRLDGRRWNVTLAFNSPVRDLSGFSFAVKNMLFHDLKVSYKGVYLPLVRPWDYAQLPLSKCFSLDTSLYNDSRVYDASMVAMDIFAKQNVRMYCVKNHDASRYMPDEMDEVNLVFEFAGLAKNFIFDKKQLSINSVLLAEAQLNLTTLSSEYPMTRVAGSDTDASCQFLHLVRPSEEQIYTKERVEVRRVMGDRFNQGSLLRLLSSLINKYNTDFYAFQSNKALSDDGTIHTLQDILSRLMSVCQSDKQQSLEGVYLLLHSDAIGSGSKLSTEVRYLTTHGAAVNSLLSTSSSFEIPAPFDGTSVRPITDPMPGLDEIDDKACEESLMRYHVITNDRIVTPADIKTFCYNELMTRYSIDRTMVKSLDVSRRIQQDPHGCGYEIVAEIVLAATSTVKRSFEEKIPYVEQLLQKMMEVRSSGVYPIMVNIVVEGSNQ